MGTRPAIALLLGVAVSCSDPIVRDALTSGQEGARAIGELCIPPDENTPTFAGFGVSAINVSIPDAQCASGACIVYDFQGRVTCPEGNFNELECFTPSGERVTAEVRPNLDTPQEELVYCTCQCDGPSELAPFCECPRGMACDALGLGRGGAERASAYCVKQ
jgi:hypothetical protein